MDFDLWTTQHTPPRRRKITEHTEHAETQILAIGNIGTGNTSTSATFVKEPATMKFRLFISSVQKEFARERREIARYIRKDAAFLPPVNIHLSTH